MTVNQQSFKNAFSSRRAGSRRRMDITKRRIKAETMLRACAVQIIGCTLAWSVWAAPNQGKSGDTIRVTTDQLHQLKLTPVELYPFRVQKSVIGRIGYNEDASTAVMAPFPGRVTRLIVNVGEQVKQGDPLFEMASPDVVQPQNEFIAALTSVNKARSQLKLAELGEKRQKDLFEGKAAALKAWQQAQAELVSAQNDMRAAESALDAARHRLRIVGRTDKEITAFEETGAISGGTPINAPISGTVIARKVGPGQHVRPDSGEPLYVIADLSTMWLNAHVPESDVVTIKVGQEIEARITAFQNRVVKARITVVGASSDLLSRRVVVRSEIPNPDHALKAEMFVNFRIATGEEQLSPAVPIAAVIREGDVAVVWEESAPMLMRRREVEIGIEQDGRMQIRQGLSVGMVIVERGAIFVDNEWRQ
jgi:cobalt-zinc-cadmium efflux system membrane fusion protein